MPDSVLITGASTGLGLETAIHLAERGFRVYATMRDLARREALDREAARRNVTLEVLRLDVNDQDSIDRVVSSVLQKGSIFGLINNAGIGLRGYFEDLTDQEIREVFQTNVFGNMAVTRAVLPHMRVARRGRIVMITSVGGRIGSLAVSGYCATRFAQEGFAESLAQEVKPFGIDVVIIEPGLVKTEHFMSQNRGVATGALKPASPYYTWFSREEALFDRLAESSPTRISDIAEAVCHVLRARRPRLRYVVGRRASLVITLRRLLPERLFERLYFGSIIRRITTTKTAGNHTRGAG